MNIDDGSVVFVGTEWRARRPSDCFVLKFPLAHLPIIAGLTSVLLDREGYLPTMTTEIFRFLECSYS